LLGFIHHGNFLIDDNFEIRFIKVGLTITPLAKMWTPSMDTQCQHIIMKIKTKAKALGEHVFAHKKCDTQHFSQQKQRHLK